MAPLVSLSKVRTVWPRKACIAVQRSRQVWRGMRSRWKVSPLRERVTAPLELMSQRSKPSCWAMGRAKVWRRPVTRTISMPEAWARRRAVRSSGEIWNWGLRRVPSMSVAMRRMEFGFRLAFRGDRGPDLTVCGGLRGRDNSWVDPLVDAEMADWCKSLACSQPYAI